MATKLGINARLYISSTPISAMTVAAVETALDVSDLLGPVRDVTINREKDRTDITTRANAGTRQYAAGLKDSTIEFEMNSTDDADAIVAILDAAYENGTVIAVAALDGPIATTGSKGPAGNYTVTNMTENQPIDGAISFSVQLSPESFNFRYKKTA